MRSWHILLGRQTRTVCVDSLVICCYTFEITEWTLITTCNDTPALSSMNFWKFSQRSFVYNLDGWGIIQCMYYNYSIIHGIRYLIVDLCNSWASNSLIHGNNPRRLVCCPSQLATHKNIDNFTNKKSCTNIPTSQRQHIIIQRQQY